jgi:2',3'-cyclic-nucleotide 2'-phosphodiesterase
MSVHVNVLFIGDVVGLDATRYVVSRLPGLRREHDVDLVVANAENCAPSGLGMTVELVDLLLRSGVDVITGGNHSWDGPEAGSALALPRVLRPYNLRDGVPGRGLLHVTVGNDTVTVLNLADPASLRSIEVVRGKVFHHYSGWLAAERSGTVIVDLHGDNVIEKQIFAHAVDGEAAAVLGTHSHEPTLPLHLLPGGTALVSDVGMTGPTGGVQGFSHCLFVDALRRTGDHFGLGIPPVVEGPIILGAVLLKTDNGRTVHISRLE